MFKNTHNGLFKRSIEPRHTNRGVHTSTRQHCPKGALLRLLIGTADSGGHPDPAAGQTPVFCRAAEAFDGRCVCLRPWLIHVDPAIAATPLMRGLHVPAVKHIPTLTPV